MKWLFTRKTFRWALAISVSTWMAGAGCLFGCSNGDSSSTSSATKSEVVIAGDSCASMQSHDCCARKTKTSERVSESTLPSLASLPQGMMEDCPLASHGTAVVSKASGDVSDVGLVNATRIAPANTSSRLTNSEVISLIPANRGPTYLRCCVFLI